MVNLLVPKEEAYSKISACIKEAEEIRDANIRTESDLGSAWSNRTSWHSYVVELLKRSFDDESLVTEFKGIGGMTIGRHYLSDKIDDFRRDMQTYVNRLKAIQRKLELIPQRPPAVPAGTEGTPTEPMVFVSHSSDDSDLISTVKQAFEDLNLKPLFFEKTPSGGPPVEVIAERIRKSKAVFAFFTPNSMYGETRDWIVLEIGIAVAMNKDVYSWKDEFFQTASLPRFTEQVTRYSPFEVRTVPGAHKLLREVKEAAKTLK